jgi:hypothetical protein
MIHGVLEVNPDLWMPGGLEDVNGVRGKAADRC